MKRLALFLLLVFRPIPALAGDYPARVVGITDDDTLTVPTTAKKQVKVRLTSWGEPGHYLPSASDFLKWISRSAST